jgi:hypothetical protein
MSLFSRTEFVQGEEGVRVGNDDGVQTFIVGVPAAMGPLPSRSFWRMTFDFNPPRKLTEAERAAMERAVVDAANAYLAGLPKEPQG